MTFGPEPVAGAAGAILAHSLQAGARRLRKGMVLDAAAIAALTEAGVETVVVARPEPGDLDEDTAATRIAAALQSGAENITITPAQTGRVNLNAAADGLLVLDTGAVEALNRIDPGVTLATLPSLKRVRAGQMLGTVKIIPYAVPAKAVAAAEAAVRGRPVVAVRPGQIRTAALIMTRTPGFQDKLLAKGEQVVADRLRALGVTLSSSTTVPHDTAAIAAALAAAQAPLVLILGASATSDPRDVCPAALVAAGGRLERYGMPVDPGNLLFLGDLPGARAVVGLPGCARSPALNGADWVLERLVAGVPVGDADIAAMGVGGLLKEIPVRPQPRNLGTPRPGRGAPRVEVVLLAAGAARRMKGRDKLLEPVSGRPMIAHAAKAAQTSGAQAVHVVLPPDRPRRAEALDGLDVGIVTADQAHRGMGASLAAGMAALSPETEAVIVALADMPEIAAQDFDRLIAAYDPSAGHEIVRAAAADGTPGHPVLFGRRFFENLSEIEGDTGARAIVKAAEGHVLDVPLAGNAATTDLDTPEAWAAWRARTGTD